MSIELHIERLVIDAAVLGGEHPASVQAAIERELARRLTQPGAVDALRGLGAVDRLSLPRLPHARDGRDGLGERIAAAMGQGLGMRRPEPHPSASGGAAGAVSGNPRTTR